MKRVLKGLALVAIAGSMMGNQSCEQKDQGRQLRRRVQMGQIKAPPIGLPQGGTFDFQYVANAQMYDILSKTQSFSTATVDPGQVYNTVGLSTDQADQFNQCEDPEEQQARLMMNGVSAKSILSQKASCMIGMPQGIVSGNLLDFRLTSGGGLSVGIAGIPFLTGGSFNFERSELSLTMRVMHPLQAGGNAPGDTKVIATTSQESYAHKWNASLGLNFSGFTLGPSFYYNTPLRKVVDQGFTDAVKDLKTQWDKAEPWYAMVLRNCDKYIYVTAGNKSDAGLAVGDILRIQNVVYEWSDKACDSQLISSIDYIGGPVAYAKVVTVGDNIAAAVILDKDPNYPYSPDQIIKPGARVYMEKLFVPETNKKK